MLQARLETEIRCYPYTLVLNSLRSHSIDNISVGENDDTYASVLRLTGHILRFGSTKEKRILLLVLRGSIKGQIGGREDPNPTVIQRRGDGTTIPELEYVSINKSPSQTATSALKEYGDQVAETPRYSLQRTCIDPPAFQAILSFRGLTFEGTARNGKQARNEASKKACQRLGIRIS